MVSHSYGPCTGLPRTHFLRQSLHSWPSGGVGLADLRWALDHRKKQFLAVQVNLSSWKREQVNNEFWLKIQLRFTPRKTKIAGSQICVYAHFCTMSINANHPCFYNYRCSAQFVYWRNLLDVPVAAILWYNMIKFDASKMTRSKSAAILGSVGGDYYAFLDRQKWLRHHFLFKPFSQSNRAICVYT